MATLEITTAIGCSLMCTYCPQESIRAAYGKKEPHRMSLDTFAEILKRTPDNVRIDFSGMVEPWANPATTQMLELALKAGRKVAIYSTLIGMSLEDAEKVCSLLCWYEQQIVVVCLHLPDKQMHMKGYRKSQVYMDSLGRLVDLPLGGRFPRHKLELMSMDETAAGEVHPDLHDIINRVPPWRGHTRAGNIKDEKAEAIGARKTPHHDYPITCSLTPFYDHNVVLPNGDVLLCCMDYSTQHLIGNLLRDQYWALFDSEALRQLRIENQKNAFTEKSLCRKCRNATRVEPYYAPSERLQERE